MQIRDSKQITNEELYSNPTFQPGIFDWNIVCLVCYTLNNNLPAEKYPKFQDNVKCYTNILLIISSDQTARRDCNTLQTHK